MAKPADATAKTASNIYTGMLIISLAAMILGSALLFMDYSRFPTSNPEPTPAPKTAKDLSNHSAPVVSAPNGQSIGQQ